MKPKATRLFPYGKGLRPWTPQLVTTDLWLDASDASTITLNGSTVSQWSDKSGNNRNFTQATAASQPGYSTGALNNLPILTFDGVDDFLDGGNILPATDGITAFIIARQNTIGTTSLAPFLGRANSTLVNGNWSIRGLSSTTPTQGVFVNLRTSVASYSSALTATASTDWFLYGFRYSNTANQLQAMRSGQSAGSPAVSGTAANPAETCRIAARSGGTINYLHMDIAEVVVVPTGLSFIQNPRPQIEGYLSWKYGLQGNLVSTHPYKNVPPTI